MNTILYSASQFFEIARIESCGRVEGLYYRSPEDHTSTEPVRPIRPAADPTETIERVLSRRQLKIELGDVVLTRTYEGHSLRRETYVLRTEGVVRPAERFTRFEHAAARGEVLAMERRSRLFFIESEGQRPFLLKDAGRAG